MRRETLLIAGLIAAAVVAGILVGASVLAPGGPAASVSPGPAAAGSPTPLPSGPHTQGYVVAQGKPPLRVEANYPLVEATLLTRVTSRIDGLRSTVAPDGYVNPYIRVTARLVKVTNDEPSVISLWYAVQNDDWGVGPDQAKLLLQQLVWTVTEEPGIEIVRIWQNEGRGGGASIAGVGANYEMTRKTFP